MISKKKNILDILKQLSKKYRHNQISAKDGGYVLWEYLYSYDWKTITPLVKNGLLEQSEYGIRAKLI